MFSLNINYKIPSAAVILPVLFIGIYYEQQPSFIHQRFN